MQATTATWREGGIGRGPEKLSAYRALFARYSSVTDAYSAFDSVMINSWERRKISESPANRGETSQVHGTWMCSAIGGPIWITVGVLPGPAASGRSTGRRHRPGRRRARPAGAPG